MLPSPPPTLTLVALRPLAGPPETRTCTSMGLTRLRATSWVSLFLTPEASGQTALGPREAEPRSAFGPHDCRRGSERW